MRVLIVNTHSALNLGDEAIMCATLDGLRATYPGIRVTVASNDPDSWNGYDEVAVVGSLTTWVERLKHGRFRGNRFVMPLYACWLVIAAIAYRAFGYRLTIGDAKQRALLVAYYDADLVLGCGGGNYYAYRLLSPFFVWALAALAFPLTLNKRVIMLPQSIGPIKGVPQRVLARLVFGAVNRVLVREHASAEYVAHNLRLSRRTTVLPDLAFTLATTESPLWPRGNKFERIGITVIDYRAQSTGQFDQVAYEGAVVNLLARLSVERRATIEVFCQCYGPSLDQDDRLAASRVYDKLRERGVEAVLRGRLRNCREAMEAYAELDLLIGTRMHSGIFALCRGVPVLLIGYQPKTVGTMHDLGLERYCCDIRTVSASELWSLATEILDHTADVRASIRHSVSRARTRAERWIAFLDESP